MIYNKASDLTGATPVISLKNFCRKKNLKAEILAKLEYLNPAGSVKDRVAKAMIEEAVKLGKINKDTILIEPTSGNTGVALSAYGASLGLKVIIVMPENMSAERRKLISAYGAQLVLADASRGMTGAISTAQALNEATPNSVILGQFTNPANPACHYKTTAPEIWADADGKIDIFVAGVGTGGTFTGVSRFLKEQNPKIKCVAVQPQKSPVLTGGNAGAHKIQGIGAGFIPQLLDTRLIDEVISVPDECAYDCALDLARIEGIFTGLSSGAVLYACACLATRGENAGKTIVTVLPDGGERYLSLLNTL
ncbi:MAG: cysteine synthase A [Clostridia bacterium]|nr:cysteine synthase A [Clostridia bacterium]